MSPRRYILITWAAVIALGVIIVTGGAVRVSGSGLGCPDWPTCDGGQLVPSQEMGWHGWVEAVNRYFTGVVAVVVIAGVLGSLFRKPRRRDLTAWSLGLVAGVLAQAVVGGLSVLFELNPYFVMTHFLLSMVLLWAALVLHRRARQPDGQPRAVVHHDYVWLGRAMFVVGFLVLFLGTLVTGTGPHGGEEGVRRFGFPPEGITRVHSISVWSLLAVTAITVWRLHVANADAGLVRKGEAVMASMLVQGGIGYLQYSIGVPAWLVLVHIAGATAVWASIVWFNLSMFERYEPTGLASYDPEFDARL